VASNLSMLGRIAPGEAGQVLLIAADLTRIAAALGRDTHAMRARRAVRHFARHAGPVGAAQVAQVRAGLGDDLARTVMGDPAWPALAAQMRRLESAGVDPSQALSTVLRSREIGSANSVAQVLHHRLEATYDVLRIEPNRLEMNSSRSVKHTNVATRTHQPRL